MAAGAAQEIKATDTADAKAGRAPDNGTRYYERWLSALEKLVAAKGLAEEAAIQVRKEEWVEAYRHTPHGQPVELRVGQEARRRRAASRTKSGSRNRNVLPGDCRNKSVAHGVVRPFRDSRTPARTLMTVASIRIEQDRPRGFAYRLRPTFARFRELAPICGKEFLKSSPPHGQRDRRESARRTGADR